MNKNNSKTENILNAAEGLGSSPLSLLFGLGLWGLIAALFVLGVFFIYKWDGAIYGRENCVKLESVEGVIYKIDSCKSEVVQIAK